MIKKIAYILLISFIVFIMTECSIFSKSIKFNKVYSEVFGFSTEAKSDAQNPPEKNIYIFNNEKEWSEFSNTHLNKLKISNLDFNNKKLLYLQVDWPEPLSGAGYTMESIKINNNDLNVTVKKENTTINVSSKKGIYFKYIIISTMDKNSVPDNVTPDLIIR
jgi:hypothetical protein